MNTMKIKNTKNFQFLGAPRIFDSYGFQVFILQERCRDE